MKKLILTCSRLIAGHQKVYWLSLVAQVAMILCQIFTTFMSKVLVDTLQGIDQLEKARYRRTWVIWLITGGQGNQYLNRSP
jgi:hypothetical protein